MKMLQRLACLLLTAVFLLPGCASKSQTKKVSLDPENPVSITVWHYYNGAQQKAFNTLVAEFNETTGKEMGIIVEASSQGSVVDLQTNVLDAANKKVGADNIPNVFAAYADTAYAVDKLGLVADLSEFMTQEEVDAYIDDYIEEGRFSGDNSLKIFPIAKSTEIFMLNKTDWDKFAAATGASLDKCKTIEGITELAKQYYEWTDSLTADKDDGKAFFGRDAMANYFIIGARQLGVELFAQKEGKPVLNFDEEVLRKLWDNFYVPYVSGHFAASGRFRSDDVKTGTVIAFVGSSSGATFFPDEVILDDDDSYPIAMEVFACPKFADGENIAVQQGAGMVVTKQSDAEVFASTVFLKWFTEKSRNIEFSISSGYLPVTKAANDKEFVNRSMSEATSEKIKAIVTVAIDTVNSNKLYTTKAFENGTKARDILEYSMFDKAQADRESILEKIKSGVSYTDAVALYDNDENFKAWYEQAKAELEQMVK